MDSVKIRIFGANSCEKCKSLVKAFEYHSIPFEFLDADAAENETICDKYNVDELPHIQAIYADNDKPFLTHIGYMSPIAFVEKMREYSKRIEEFFNVAKKVASENVDTNAVKKQAEEWKKDGKSGCAGCGRKNSAQSRTE